jgi:hypoxia-inducible factor (prolyl hydroxylase)
MIDSVIVHFAKRIPPYAIGGRSRAMIACYPGSGTRYIKHVDNPIKDGRCITSIYYCNEDWVLSEDGGTLRLYPETSQVPMDIDPQADRLVFFWSDQRNPHEVLPVFRHRLVLIQNDFL